MVSTVPRAEFPVPENSYDNWSIKKPSQKKRKKETISSLSTIKVKGTSEIKCVVQDKFKKHSQNEEERCEQKYCEI